MKTQIQCYIEYFSIYRSIPYTNQGMCVEVQICPKRTPPPPHLPTRLRAWYVVREPHKNRILYLLAHTSAYCLAIDL